MRKSRKLMFQILKTTGAHRILWGFLITLCPRTNVQHCRQKPENYCSVQKILKKKNSRWTTYNPSA